MNENMKKLIDLLKTDEGFRAKLQAKAAAYAGDRTDEEAAFNAILVPLAAEYGLPVTWEDMKACAESLKDQEMDAEELGRVAGGADGYGAASFKCYFFGLGIGAAGGMTSEGAIAAAVCVLLGLGQGDMSCLISGDATPH